MTDIRSSTIAMAVAAALLAAGCAHQPTLPAKLDIPKRADRADPNAALAAEPKTATTSVTENPVPLGPPLKPAPPVVSTPIVADGAADIVFNFSELPLPAFVQAIYAQALKRNVNVDPAVMARKDLVTLRSGKPLTPAEAEKNARQVLKSYGIAVQDFGGLVRVVPDTSNAGYIPEIRRGRALPETPLPLRPVFQMVELNVVRTGEIASYIRSLVGEKVRITEDASRNALMLNGTGDDVQAALDLINVLDQPLFKGRNSIRITPVIFSAEELTKRLTEILIQEGYSVGTSNSPGSVQFPITLLPVAGINSIIVFAQSKEVISHIVDWAKVLDKPAERSVGRNFFSYQVRNTDAARLKDTVQQLLNASPARTGTAATAASTATTTNSVVVDKGTNTILFRASGEEYTDIIRLLRELDRAARQVLIDVTVLEVKLDDSVKSGVDWVFSQVNSSGRNVAAGGSGLNKAPIAQGVLSGAPGFIFSQLDGAGNVRAMLQASATDGRSTVLSNPKVAVRNGESANMQVGSAIPVLTQQQTNSATGGTGVISSVQYVDTGTILRVKPVIHSSDSVDIEIQQEVSQPDGTGVGGSPGINKRSLDTKLTLRHGETYALGGLISELKSAATAGVPLLKDIPVLGRAFKLDSKSINRVELVLLITPYIMSDSEDARAVSDAIRNQLGPWAREQVTSSTTK